MQYPHKAFTFLSDKYADLRYLKTTHKRVEYRIVYDISDERKEVLIIFFRHKRKFL